MELSSRFQNAQVDMAVGKVRVLEARKELSIEEAGVEAERSSRLNSGTRSRARP